MGVLVTKEEFNLRSKLNDLDYGVVPLEKMPAGSIIQYNYDTGPGSHFTTTSTSFVNLSYSVSISPRFANSLMLIELSALGQQPNTTTGVSCVTIYRNNTTNLGDSTSLYGMSATGEFASTGGVYVTAPQTFFVYDEPKTREAVSYHLWGRTTSSGTAYCTHNSVTRTLSVKEIRQ